MSIKIKICYRNLDYIYRRTAKVHWNKELYYLYTPKPKEWAHIDWFKHIIAIAKEEYGCQLFLTNSTKWTKIPEELARER